MILAAGCTKSAPVSSTSGSPVKPDVPDVSATPAMTVAGGGYHLTGQGITNTGKFHLNAGPATFTAREVMTTRNPAFIVSLYDADGHILTMGLLMSTSSNPGLMTEKHTMPAAGDYYLNVDTPNSWDITISQ